MEMWPPDIVPTPTLPLPDTSTVGAAGDEAGDFGGSGLGMKWLTIPQASPPAATIAPTA